MKKTNVHKKILKTSKLAEFEENVSNKSYSSY